MKRYICIILSLAVFISYAGSVYAEGDMDVRETDSPSMTIEVHPDTDIVVEDSIQSTTDNDDGENFYLGAGITDMAQGESEILQPDDTHLLGINNSTDGWSSSANMTTGRSDCDFVTISNELYVIGGMGANGYLYTIEKYNATSNSWQNVTTIPNETKGFAAVSVGTKIYIIGGYQSGRYTASVQVYDTISDAWSSTDSMLIERDQAAALYMDNKIYVFGGRNATGFANSYEYYDFTDSAWHLVTTGFNDSLIRIGADVQYHDGQICMYGGIDKTYSNCGVDIYPSSNLKVTEELIPDGYDDISIAWGSDKAMVFATNTSTNNSLIKEITGENGVIQVSEVYFAENTAHAKYTKYVIYNGYLYAVGGYNVNSKVYMTTMRRYSVYYGDYTVGDGSISNNVTANGNSVTLNVDAGREYMIFVNVKNITSFNDYTFTLEYPENSFSVEDSCALTVAKDGMGSISGTPIYVTDISDTGVSFMSSEDILGGAAISKSVNAIILKANSSGQRTITYSMIN